MRDEGRAEVRDGALVITGSAPLHIPVAELREVELFRMHGLGRMIRFAHDAATIFPTVARLNLLGYFAIINFAGTGRRYEKLRAHTA